MCGGHVTGGAGDCITCRRWRTCGFHAHQAEQQTWCWYHREAQNHWALRRWNQSHCFEQRVCWLREESTAQRVICQCNAVWGGVGGWHITAEQEQVKVEMFLVSVSDQDGADQEGVHQRDSAGSSPKLRLLLAPLRFSVILGGLLGSTWQAALWSPLVCSHCKRSRVSDVIS